MQNIFFENRTKRVNRVLQFGEGNFLRAFVDYIIDCSNEAGVFDSNITIVKPIEYGNLDRFDRQDNLYTVILRGIRDGQTSVENHIVSSVNETVDPFFDFDKYNNLMKNEDFRFVVSNTTEAGIVFSEQDKFEEKINNTFPAKITQLLYQRYQIFNGDKTKGFIFLPVELIEKNGDNLKKCVLQYCKLWKLEASFTAWVNEANIFCNTLVDRIVSGYPRAEQEQLWEKLGYKDELMVTGEPFGFWAIGSENIEKVKDELKLSSNVEVIFANDIEPYKQRKVRILNGAHTSMVLGAYLCGYYVVEECMNDDVIRGYMMSCIYDEIIPNIDLDKDVLEKFADSVVERFKNPFLNHKLLDISLNSTSKWRARVLPSLLDYYHSKGETPEKLTISLALYFAFYIGVEKKDDGYVNYRDGKPYLVKDDEYVLNIYAQNSMKSYEQIVSIIMSDEKIWGMDLMSIDGLFDKVVSYLYFIDKSGIKAVLENVIRN